MMRILVVALMAGAAGAGVGIGVSVFRRVVRQWAS